LAPISFGVRVPNSGPLTSVDNITRAATEAEEMGFDSIFLHDHVVWSTEMHRHHISSGAHEALVDDQTADFFEALTTIGYLAAKTTAVRIGVACLVMPTRNPIYAAKQLATIDHLTGGRLIAGVGLGSKATKQASEFEVFGVPFAARAAMTDEYVEAMRAIWTEPLASYSGRYVSFEDAEIYPKPLQPNGPDVWVGGWTDAAARRAGRLGDGWVPGWLSPVEMARGAQIVRDTAQQHDREPNFTIAVEKLTVIDQDRDAAMTRALPTVETSSKTYERDIDRIQFALDRHIFGSVSDVQRRVEEFVDAGVTHFELKFIYPTMDELTRQMELWADEILPKYR
jgi:probable F420-dependent oxidoreductase